MINESILIRKRKNILDVECCPNAWRDKILVSLFFFFFIYEKHLLFLFSISFGGMHLFFSFFRNQRLNGVWYTQRKLQ